MEGEQRQNEDMFRRAVSVSLAVFLSACSQIAGEGSAPRTPDPIVLELVSVEKAPMGVLSYGGEDQAGALGTHCWANRCVDFVGPPSPKAFTEVPENGTIELQGDGKAESITIGREPKEEFGQLRDEREVRVENGRAQLDLQPGSYVLIVFATWPEGDAVLTFGLEAT